MNSRAVWLYHSLYRHSTMSMCLLPGVMHELAAGNWYALQVRAYSTQPARGSLSDRHRQSINDFVFSLTPDEKRELMSRLSKASQTSQSASPSTEIPQPTKEQLRYVAMFSAVPFVGFGLLDNTIMLTAGEYIDLTFGAWLGITTMAAAALGNLVSDVLGITTAGFVEQSALKLGLKTPDVSLEQMSLRRTRWSANLGRCIGVCIGCLLGMWPLFVFAKDQREGE